MGFSVFEQNFMDKSVKLALVLTWKPVKGSLADTADPDQMPHNVASDQGLQCLLTGFSIKNRIKDRVDPAPLK